MSDTPPCLFVPAWNLAGGLPYRGDPSTETIGGALLLTAAVVALVWANSPWAPAYEALRDFKVGPAAWHLDLTLAT